MEEARSEAIGGLDIRTDTWVLSGAKDFVMALLENVGEVVKWRSVIQYAALLTSGEPQSRNANDDTKAAASTFQYSTLTRPFLTRAPRTT